MTKIKENEKPLNIGIPEKDHISLKILAAKNRTSIKAIVRSAIKVYLDQAKWQNEDDELEFEELDEEDLKDIEKGRKEIAEGKYKTFEEVKELLPCQQ